MKNLRRLIRDCSGATAIEYALIASIVSIAIVAALKLTGSSLTTSLNNVAAAFPG